MNVHYLNKEQLKTMLDYAVQHDTRSFTMDTRRLPHELCRYRDPTNGSCRITHIACKVLGTGCNMLCIRETPVEEK